MNRKQALIRLYKTIDLVLVAGAFWLAYLVRFHSFHPPASLPDTDIIFAIFLVALIAYLFYVEFISRPFEYILRSGKRILAWVFKAATGITAVLILFLYIFQSIHISRLFLLLFLVFTSLFLYLSKLIELRSMTRHSPGGPASINVLIIGIRERAKDVVRYMEKDLLMHRHIHGCLEVGSGNQVGQEILPGIKILGTLDHLEDFIVQGVIDEIVFALPLMAIPNAAHYILMAESAGITIRIIPEWQIYSLKKTPQMATIVFEDLAGLPTMTLVTARRYQQYLLLKNLIDLAAAGLISLVIWPLFPIVALAIKLSSPGPVFYRQKRVGLHGRHFDMIKFRTMVKDADNMLAQIMDKNEVRGPVFKMKDDPRVIPYVGRFLRRSSLDELPQILNVLKGDMSLVGPRPALPREVSLYKLSERRRLSVKPGITGLWQCTPDRNAIDFEERLQLDLYYIDNWSFWLDVNILLRTLMVVFSAQGI
ncbi:MAG: sugar transferase [Thermodesulfobacteriota bacterium]